jgi:heme exporter protein C
MSSAERMMAAMTARRGERVLAWLAGAALMASAILSLVASPPDADQGDLVRLMYIHVPAAWVAYMAFGVVFAGSVAYLVTKRSRWDRIAAASAEIGVLFTALTIVLGSIWAKPVWGTWWTWDPRLTTTAILLLIYLGYLAVRRLSDNPRRRGRWAAVVGIVGFIDVPIVHLSVVWWRSLHQEPTVLRLGKPTIEGTMLAALLIAVGAFTLLYLYLMALRLRVGRLEERALAEALSPVVGPPPPPAPEESPGGGPEEAEPDAQPASDRPVGAREGRGGG